MDEYIIRWCEAENETKKTNCHNSIGICSYYNLDRQGHEDKYAGK
ncbi:hypothetical protein GCM10008910_35740 [Faecalicatena orotica]